MKERVRAMVFCVPVAFVIFFATVASPLSAQTLCGSGTVCVTTWQNDNYRTGQNLSEGTLLYSNLLGSSFGQLCSTLLDGQVYSQPLVATNVTIPPNGGHTYSSVVYVVTQNDTLYAIQGDPADTFKPPCTILNGNGNGTSLLSFLPSGQYPVDCHNIGAMAHGCGTIAPNVGILGTPVINISGSSGTIYLVTFTQNCQGQCSPTAFYHYLHAIDIAGFTETDSGPVQICANECGPYTSSAKFSHDHIQRPGLLYVTAAQSGLPNPTVYAAFSMMDGTLWPYPNGLIFGYNASNLSSSTVYAFSTSLGNDSNKTSYGGGIWQGAAGPAFGVGDASGDSFIYFNTGNGTFSLTSSGTDAGDSFLKLLPNLTMPTTGTPYFTPADQYYRNYPACNPPDGNDLDYGSGGPMLIPDNELANWGHLAVSGEKEGDLWFIDRTNPGGHLTTCDGNCTCTATNTNIVQMFPASTNLIHNSPAFWEDDFHTHPAQDYIFVGPYGSQLTQYGLCNLSSDTVPICSRITPKGSVDTNGSPVTFPWGVTPAISAAAAETAPDAVVWGITADSNPESTTPGILYAFDANTMQELYASSTCSSDAMAAGTKYSIPTVANGYVYVGTQGKQGDTGYPNSGRFYLFGFGSTCN